MLVLSPEEKARIEQNRLQALERKRKLEDERAHADASQKLVVNSSTSHFRSHFIDDKQEDANSPVPTSSVSILSYLSDPGWKTALADEFNKKYFKDILQFLETEKKSGRQVFPPENEIFNAFNYTPFENIKVVIIGQVEYSTFLMTIGSLSRCRTSSWALLQCKERSKTTSFS